MSNKKSKITFDKKVLKYVEYSRQVDDSILSDRLITSYDDFGSLLHYAAFLRNAVVVRQLIALGSEVDFVGRDGRTPFMYAVEGGCTATLAKIFLKAKANIDVVDDDYGSVLQRALGDFTYDHPLVKLFASKIRTERTTTTPDELAERLIAAGCEMYEAAAFRDIEVMQCMLQHGIYVNSKSLVLERTALHRAAEMDDVDIAKWLLNKGADVNARDKDAYSVVYVAACWKSKKVLKILLERGADPNHKDDLDGSSPLLAICLNSNEMEDYADTDECVKLLLQHGALLDNSLTNSSKFDSVLKICSEESAKMLIAQLAMLEMLGTSNTKKGTFSKAAENRSKRPEFEVFRQLCLQVLPTKLVEELSLFDLLSASESRLNSMVRRKTFAAKVKRACLKHKLSDSHYYYDDTLMMRIDKARRVVKLEDKAILVICKLFRCSYNQCHNFAREIVGYLREHELELLIQV